MPYSASTGDIVKKNIAPFPSSDSTKISLPCRSAIRRTIASPAPLPG
jgi:hypothetical protein